MSDAAVLLNASETNEGGQRVVVVVVGRDVHALDRRVVDRCTKVSDLVSEGLEFDALNPAGVVTQSDRLQVVAARCVNLDERAV